MKKLVNTLAMGSVLFGITSPSLIAIADTVEESNAQLIAPSEKTDVEVGENPITTEIVPTESNISTTDSAKNPASSKTTEEKTADPNYSERASSTEVASGLLGTSPWSIDSEGVLHIGAGEFTNTSISPWQEYSSQINKIVFEGEVIGAPRSTNLFAGLANVVSILNLNLFITTNVIDMSSMFSDMTSLTDLDLSSFNTSNVTSMENMFRGIAATTLDVSSFDTANVTTMYGMFSTATKLSTLDLSTFNTTNVTNMGMMFMNMTSLINLNIKSFDTSKVTNMYMMFDAATNLSNLDLSFFNTSQVTSMGGMFRNMVSLNSLNISSFDTSKVKNLKGMFEGSTIHVLSLGENTSLVNSTNDNVSLNSPSMDETYTGSWQTLGSGTELSPNGDWVGDTAALINRSTTNTSDTYVWEPIKKLGQDITVKYINTDGEAIAEDIILSGNIGENYTSEQKDIDGYTFKEVQGNATGQFTDQAQTVTYVYTKASVAGGDVTATYVDIEGNKISDNVVKSGNVGETYTTEQKDIDGYTFKEVQGNTTGQFTDQAQTVTYVYTKDEVPNSTGIVIVKYEDVDGKTISEDIVKSGSIGEGYTTEIKDIEGYTFKEIQGNATGQFKDQAQTVTYVYTKDKADPELSINDSSNDGKLGSLQETHKDTMVNKDKSNTPALPETGETSGMFFSVMGFLILGLISSALLFKNKVFRK